MTLSQRRKTVDHLLGDLILDGVEANSTYEVSSEISKDDKSTENYFDAIEALCSSKAEVEQTTHNSTPRNDMSLS